jgi:3,4-dihydroxy 2-butanone 4-phosphate synthase/GTP cyclohydrolase II
MNRVTTAIKALQNGKPVIILDDESREGEGDLAFPASVATPELVNFCLEKAKGLICVSMSRALAKTLEISNLPENGKDVFGTPFGYPVGLATNSSGISAQDRASTIKHLANKNAAAGDFCYPGHVSTLIAHDGGLRERLGHTEAVLELLSLAGYNEPGVISEILTPNGSIAKLDYIEQLSETHDIPYLFIDDIVEFLDEKLCA